jgi:hypothetical protein
LARVSGGFNFGVKSKIKKETSELQACLIKLVRFFFLLENEKKGQLFQSF